MKQAMTEAYAAFVGIDWADEKHDVCLQQVGSESVESSILAHTPEAIAAWAESLQQLFYLVCQPPSSQTKQQLQTSTPPKQYSGVTFIQRAAIPSTEIRSSLVTLVWTSSTSIPQVGWAAT